jgi:Tol biopolymer transport system component
MALSSGTRLGPYEIQSAIGAGGMGEVYLARDTRLDRTVAVKILPSHLSESTEAKQRFEREARTISSLNHPNICTLHDVGSQDGTSYLVMEYVQGETLETRLQKGPLPLKQALECGIQICDALEKAHRAGIVHRDLKPGNIMLTASGTKLLDFGLAKPVAAVLGAQSLTDKASNRGNLTPSTPTMNISMLSASPAVLTQQGTIVGTFQYMAPEVVQGRDADARSDIFSFGCVLYEMVTGRRAFEGKSQLSVLTAILEKDPEPLATVQPTTPPALDYAVQTCLEKNPDNRFQTAHDVKLQLAWIAKSGSQVGAPAIAPAKATRRSLGFALLAVVLLAVVALAAAFWSSPRKQRVLRTNILPPQGTQFETLYRNGPPALSPDGKRLAFVAQQDGKNSIWIRSLDKLEATPLRDTEEAFFPFWSPDGNTIAFFMRGKLWRLDLNGGSPATICEAPQGRGGSWGRSDVIVFAPFTSGPVAEVSASGGTPRPVTKTPSNTPVISDRWPILLPDGKHFLYLHSPNGTADGQNEIRFASLDGGEERLLIRGRVYTFQYASGWLLADRDGSLQAWKFDPSSGKLSSESVSLAEKIASDDITALSVFSVSQQDLLLYQQGTGATGDRHVWFDSAGKQIAQLSDPAVYGATRISPDGSRIATTMVNAMGNKGGASPLWLWDLKGGTRAPLSADTDYVDDLVWSADGRTIFFDVFESGGDHKVLRSLPADGSQPEQTLINSDNDRVPVDVTADGKWLLYEERPRNTATTDAVLKALPLVKDAQDFTVLTSVARDSNARLISGKNDWLAYQSNQSGRSEIYLTRFPRPGAKYQVSQSGGAQPVWSRDGKLLFYLDGANRMTSVMIETTTDAVKIGTPKTLFSTGIRHSIPVDAYDVARDGRFLVVNSITESTAPVVLVTNWDTELKK